MSAELERYLLGSVSRECAKDGRHFSMAPTSSDPAPLFKAQGSRDAAYAATEIIASTVSVATTCCMGSVAEPLRLPS